MNGAKFLELPFVPLAISSCAAPPAQADLFERFRSGDRDAFTEIYRTHYPGLFRFALHMTGDRTRACEAVQDVFVWLIHHPAAFDPRRGELRAFLAGVARKVVQRHERQGRRWLPLETAPQPAEEPDPGRAVDTDALRKAIAVLPLPYREAIVLCGLENKSYEEAAAVVGCAVGTIRSRMHRARELLARKLGVKE